MDVLSVGHTLLMSLAVTKLGIIQDRLKPLQLLTVFHIWISTSKVHVVAKVVMMRAKLVRNQAPADLCVEQFGYLPMRL
jgi:hypothetical protein